ncbi:MAG: GntR family transcriptional regulator [Clostridia bacterium]|nr:GntR family transcriptional regulator [Clostridia bacterium]
MFVIDPRSKAPIYEQLRDQLRWQITMGFLAPEEPLPSVRKLSGELGINPNTIQKAYREMEQEGLIYSQPGRGSFVTPATGEQRQKQQDSQMALLEKEIRKAKEMGISRERVEGLTQEIFQE